MTRETVKEYSQELLFLRNLILCGSVGRVWRLQRPGSISTGDQYEKLYELTTRSSQYMKDKFESHDAKISKLMACGVQMDSDQDDGVEEPGGVLGQSH
ncbi:uncharacterized protein LOC135560252 isoform X3 [Oncorhynchus nerka]|uniref:uncharacterized protein LOC135560252 isoform X3 n=1 Tax=Oncorhynchus nerka TaxID=8023 RepID=UPI0031B8118D